MKKSRRTYNGVHLNKKSNTQDVVEQSLTEYQIETSQTQQEHQRIHNKSGAFAFLFLTQRLPVL